MSIYEFLERLDADPFDPELLALFLGKADNKTNSEEEATL